MAPALFLAITASSEFVSMLLTGQSPLADYYYYYFLKYTEQLALFLPQLPLWNWHGNVDGSYSLRASPLALKAIRKWQDFAGWAGDSGHVVSSLLGKPRKFYYSGCDVIQARGVPWHSIRLRESSLPPPALSLSSLLIPRCLFLCSISASPSLLSLFWSPHIFSQTPPHWHNHGQSGSPPALGRKARRAICYLGLSLESSLGVFVKFQPSLKWD